VDDDEIGADDKTLSCVKRGEIGED